MDSDQKEFIVLFGFIGLFIMMLSVGISMDIMLYIGALIAGGAAGWGIMSELDKHFYKLG